MVSQLPNGAQFYPMLWGTKQKDQFQKSVKAGYAKTVLGMNECVFLPLRSNSDSHSRIPNCS